jgi:hypothetical protein
MAWCSVKAQEQLYFYFLSKWKEGTQIGKYIFSTYVHCEFTCFFTFISADGNHRCKANHTYYRHT